MIFSIASSSGLWALVVVYSLLSFKTALSLPITDLNLEDPIDEITMLDMMKSSSLFRNLPPLVSLPAASERTLVAGEVPDYVLDFAPVVHLYSEERYLPYNVEKFVSNFHACFRNGSLVPGGESPLKLQQLEELDKHIVDYDTAIFMTADSDFDKDPEWITGKHNIPNVYDGAIEDAPATLIVVDKGNGWVDAYWFFFYSFNLGPFVMGCGPYGNHVGDWEHTLVRFYNGEPKIVWMSAHGGGGTYFYDNLEKLETAPKRPVIFSARGTHANYAAVGQHSHDLPYSMLSDFADRGPLWDPSRNYLAYTWDGTNLSYGNGSEYGREERLGKWLSFTGHWGDNDMDPKDPRQHWSPWQWKYIEGPTGPITKNLLRVAPCQSLKHWKTWGGCQARRYPKMGEGIESEGSHSCGNIFRNVRPVWLKTLLHYLTLNGIGCYLADLFLG
ncbi:unnamed protein product [Kuraishia capsulata CBS 1993]|uniref:Vacuolar protein sorting-associated protein 62 n=1 Tax=Kuraishia capsulata CBS 1993 TaxID=1382522 RepID=W6MUI0_9ASCO|nr:uncharacterized protein KUCA_T00005285001 [Kuraishia capsulata CBS 1993]CDK29297.1 unnamed protein product [Kuraishia capsulata CBS 1993]